MLNRVFLVVGLFLVSYSSICALEKQELMQAMNDWSYQDIKAVVKNHRTKVYEFSEHEGYVDIVPIGGGGGIIALFFGNGINHGNQTQSGDLAVAYGGAGGFMVNLSRHWAMGGLFGGFSGASSDKVGNVYHEFGVRGAFQHLLVKHRMVILPKWMLDLDFGVGVLEAGYTNCVTTETTTSLDSSRNGVGLSGLVGLDLRYRITPLFHAGLTLGYFYGRIDQPSRGGSSLGSESLDMSSSFMMMGLGVNF